jgi:DUF971 family protein
MRPADLQIIGNQLAIKWSNGAENFILLENLRRACPCAECKGETDILGNLHRNPPKPLTQKSFELKRFVPVGGYAVQPVWGDGHATGLFSFEYLKAVAV